MKRIISVFLVLLTVILLAGCNSEHTHEFSSEWTCDSNSHWHNAICEHTTEVSEKAEHTWDEGAVSVEPTEQAEGEKKYTCTVCKFEKVEKIDKLAHTHQLTDVAEKAATCTEEGNVAYKHCAGCNKNFDKDGKELSEVVVAALGHKEEVVAGKAATCTEKGLTDGKKCSVCGETLLAQEEISKLAHTPAETVKENEVAATCKAAGSYDLVVYCSVCEEEISREAKTVEKLAHTEEVVAGKAATCTEKGLTDGKKCSVCGETLVAQEEIAALGHDYSTTWSKDETNHWKECSCGEKTNIETHKSSGQATEENAEICTVCEYVITPEINHEHSWTAADCDTPKTCSSCGETEGEALGHTEEVVAGKAATCTETGLTDGKKCSVCGETLVAQEEIAALKHNYVASYVWSEDLSTVTATGICSNDETHVIDEQATATYTVVTEARIGVVGIERYTATFETLEAATKDVEINNVTLYFVPNLWSADGATFFAKAKNSQGEITVALTEKTIEGYYQFSCPVVATHIDFIRSNSTGTEYWNGFDNVELTADNNMFIVTEWDSYVWDEYTSVLTTTPFVAGETLYLQLNGDWLSGSSVAAHIAQFNGTNGESGFIAFEVADAANGILKVTVPEGVYSAVRFGRVNTANVGEIWNVSGYTVNDNDSTTNMIVLYNGWNDMIGGWSTFTE